MAIANSKRNARSLRVVLYLRMSSDQQEQSIPSQRAELTSYAKKHGYKIVGEYVDSAISGDDTHKRAGFLAMRDDCSRGGYDCVLCWDQDRFGRFDILDAGFWIAPFREAGVRLETIAQGKIDWEDLVGQLIYSVNQMGKAQFLRDIGRNTARGLLNAARSGKAGTGGRPPLGYRSANGVVEIVLGEAKIVLLVFALYLEPGGSLIGVAAELNRRKILTPGRARANKTSSKAVWRDSTVRMILTNEKYVGSFKYGCKNRGRYFAFRDGEVVPRRKSDRNSKAEPIVIENKFEAIVSREMFDQVQVKLEASKTKTAPKSARQYLLSGLVRCGDCGGAMGGTQPARPSYHCSQYHNSGRSTCFHNTIKEAPLVSVISRKIQDEYLSEPALARLRKALEKEQGRSRPRPEDRKRLKAELEQLDRKIDQGAERVLEAPSELVPTLYRKLEEFKSDRDRLNAELEALARHDTQRNGKDGSEIDRAIEALKNLGAALNKARPEDSKELLASIVTKIELFYDHGETGAGRKTSIFSHGVIYLRPDAGESRGRDSAKSTHLSNTRPFTQSRDGTSPFGPRTHRRSRKQRQPE